MVHKVWFQLVDARGNKLNFFGSVRLTDEDDVADFTEAVKAECGTLLDNTPAASLSVFESINDRAPLLKSLPIGNRGRNGEAPLLVRVADSSRIGWPSGSSASRPRPQLLLDATKYGAECSSLDSWAVDEVHDIPAIASLFNDLGRCTNNGKLQWRQEDHAVVSLLLGGWLGHSDMEQITKKDNILIGSPGTGKSTLLCLLAFHAVFKLEKNVLVYRQLGGGENCLVYLGYGNGQVVYSTKKNCRHANVKRIYDALIEQHTAANFWLFLDGFEHLQIPEGLGGFRMLAPSHQVDLRPSEETYLYCILHPSWKKDDLVKLAHEVYGWDMQRLTIAFTTLEVVCRSLFDPVCRYRDLR